MTDNKIVEVLAKSYDGRITKVFKKSQQNNSETVTKENDKEIPKERYIYIYIYFQKKDKKLFMI